MEKLQIAIEKARASRLAQRGAPSGDSAPLLARAQAQTQGQDGAWASLSPLDLSPETLLANRVVAFQKGPTTTYYDILRTKLRDEAKRRGFRRIALTSTRPAAGKSTTLANLACAFERLPHYHTMIFDFDLRRPSLARLLGVKPEHNMGQVLTGEITFETHMRRYGTNVAIGLNNGPVHNSSELLQSERTHDLLNAVEEIYQPDLMLFDMPPFLAADDTQGFLGFIDGVVLVVEAETTTRHQIDTVEQKLSELTTVVGVVLNKCPFPDDTDAGAYGAGYY